MQTLINYTQEAADALNISRNMLVHTKLKLNDVMILKLVYGYGGFVILKLVYGYGGFTMALVVWDG